MEADESQWASSTYALCAVSIDCVITLTLVLFSFKGSVQDAFIPEDTSNNQAIAANLLDLVVLAFARVVSTSLNLLMPNSLCAATHFVTFCTNTLVNIYALVKFALILGHTKEGSIEHGDTKVSSIVVIVALIQGPFVMAWLEWYMTVKYRSTLSKILDRAYSRRLSDFTAYELALQANRTPMQSLNQWNSEVHEPLLPSVSRRSIGYNSNLNSNVYWDSLQQHAGDSNMVVHRPSFSDQFDFYDAYSEHKSIRDIPNQK